MNTNKKSGYKRKKKAAIPPKPIPWKTILLAIKVIWPIITWIISFVDSHLR